MLYKGNHISGCHRISLSRSYLIAWRSYGAGYRYEGELEACVYRLRYRHLELHMRCAMIHTSSHHIGALRHHSLAMRPAFMWQVAIGPAYLFAVCVCVCVNTIKHAVLCTHARRASTHAHQPTGQPKRHHIAAVRVWSSGSLVYSVI